jgi:hypothetical protein
MCYDERLNSREYVSVRNNKETSVNIDDFRGEPIKIESLKHGVLEFLELMLKDISWLGQEQTKKLSFPHGAFI